MCRKLLTISLTALLLISCATSPLGRKQFAFMQPGEMDKMGMQAFDSMKQQTPVETDSRLNKYVNCIAQSLIRESNLSKQQWEVVVFRDKSANAFALPGGKIGVHTGLLPYADNQHRLATVVGHEIGHVISQHANERVSQQFAAQQGLSLAQVLMKNPEGPNAQMAMAALGLGAQFGVLLPFSRVQESEADIVGLQLMARAGFDPRESIALWQNMGRSGGGGTPEFLSTHPSHATRINDLQKEMGQAMHLYQQAQGSGKRPKCQ